MVTSYISAVLTVSYFSSYFYLWNFPGGSDSKVSAYNAGDRVRSLGQEYPLEKGMATHSSILAWKTPWIKEPGGLQSMGSQGRTQLEQLSTHKNFIDKVSDPTLQLTFKKLLVDFWFGGQKDSHNYLQ